MSFLAPLFLLGALAVALPIALHLIRRQSRQSMPFSSLMFLTPTPPRITRRSRLENLWLLITRCLLILLLTVAFARPFFSNNPPAAENTVDRRRTLLLIDSSASMRRDGLWDDARNKAIALLNQVKPVDEAALYAFDQELHPIVSFDQWNALPPPERVRHAKEQLNRLEPSWLGTHLDATLNQAVHLLQERTIDQLNAQRATPSHISIISDFQEGTRLAGLSAIEWPSEVSLTLERAAPGENAKSNAAIQPVADPLQFTSDKRIQHIRISNAADSNKEQFQLGWTRPGSDQWLHEPLSAYVPPGQSRVVQLPLPEGSFSTGEILLAGDDVRFDNRLFFVTPDPEEVIVLYTGAPAAANPADQFFYVERALRSTPRQRIQLKPTTNGPLSVDELTAADFWIIAEPLSAQSVQSAQEFLRLGKNILITATSPDISATLNQILPNNQIQVAEAHLPNYAMLARMDLDHPLLAAFNDPRYSDFSKIHFWKYRIIETNSLPNSRILARFDTGHAALLELPLPAGNVLVFAGTWTPTESQLVLSTKFVPLLYSLLEYGSVNEDSRTQYETGSRIDLSRFSKKEPVHIEFPDQSAAELSPDETLVAQQPGIYNFSGAGAPGMVAVNLPAHESQTAPLTEQELEQRGLLATERAVRVESTERAERYRLASEIEARQKIWWWLILAAIVLLVFETWLAGRLSRATASV